MEGAVIGNYQIVRKLGEGGMGAVYLGQHTLLGRRAAIKVLLPALSSRPDIVNRFFNEARAVTSISDPGIVQVFDFGYHTDGSAFIVMEFLEGEALDVRLHRMGRLPTVDALRIARQVASSLAAAHAARIIHRDLKPENIFVVRDQEAASGERSKILDFGIAKLSDDNPGKIKTHTGALMGTPVYMSPEQCRGLADLDHRSDIYALGCVLFHLLAGRPPFEGEGMGDIIAAHIREVAPPLSSRLPGASPQLDALLARMLAKQPVDRFQSMTEVAVAIGQIIPYLTSPDSPTQYVSGYQAGLTPPPPMGFATPPPPATPTTLGSSTGQVGTAPPPKKSRAGFAIAGLLVVGGAIGAIVVFGQQGAAKTPAAAPIIDAPAATPDAAVKTVPPPDAAVVVPAATPDAMLPPPPDAPPVLPDAPPVHHHTTTPHTTTTPPHTTPKGPTVPVDTCDHAIDTDCDGIPDRR
ncbi:MAG TPA: serine/threonine-protein kinase [Kofleriaceae bacterium]